MSAPVGGFTESPGGVGLPVIERWAVLANEARGFISERQVAHGGPLPPIPGDEAILAVDCGHSRYRYAITDNGQVWRADGGRRGPQWLDVARLVEGAE